MTRYADPQLRPAGAYDPNPTHRLEPGVIGSGSHALARAVAAGAASTARRSVVLDGYVGVQFEDLRVALDKAFTAEGVSVTWVDVRTALKQEAAIEALVAPYLGGDDPLFGRRFEGELHEFFDADRLAALQPAAGGLTVLYGAGAALAGWSDALTVYVDLPKDTIQYRSKAGLITNLGSRRASDAKSMYKRFFFVDWLVLNKHKQALLPRIAMMIDGQDTTEPTFMSGDDLRAALESMSRSHVRARPWFTPGPWGGQWLKALVPHLPRDVPNYAWSFELITPENGVTFESEVIGSSAVGRLEVSFDTLMFQAGDAVLGDHARRFGTDFPIRFNYLDTMAGGNLSLQVHPTPAYVREHFGEPFTQDETYYLVDCTPGAKVFVGFQAGVDPAAFRAQLERSARDGTPVDVERFVKAVPAEQHGLYLIPHGTVHCSGVGNVVLEISATPYLYTFKMYDWLRLDLEGEPRPLNIERGLANLDFLLQGEVVERELVSHPSVVGEGAGWRRSHLPTHGKHFYDVERLELQPGAAVTLSTDGSPQVLAVVEGGPVRLRSGMPWGPRQGEHAAESTCHYAETHVVPAAARSFELRNDGAVPAKVVLAFLKPVAGPGRGDSLTGRERYRGRGATR